VKQNKDGNILEQQTIFLIDAGFVITKKDGKENERRYTKQCYREESKKGEESR